MIILQNFPTTCKGGLEHAVALPIHIIHGLHFGHFFANNFSLNVSFFTSGGFNAEMLSYEKMVMWVIVLLLNLESLGFLLLSQEVFVDLQTSL